MTSPHITVLYFAAASTSTGLFEQSVALSTGDFPLSSLAALLVSLHPNTGLDKVLETSQWSVNAEMIPESDVPSVCLHGGDEVAVICPVSGVIRPRTTYRIFGIHSHNAESSFIVPYARSIMCRQFDVQRTPVAKTPSLGTPLPAFTAHRLTPSTFLIKEWDDIWVEHPFIYAKIVPAAQTILLLDTGCGGKTNNPDIQLKDLRTFIETIPVNDNAGKPLNPGGKLSYIVVQSHCHYDHILAAEAFAVDSPILGSSYDPTFAAPENLPSHSLCDNLGIPTPSYKLDLVPHFHSITSTSGNVPLGVTVLHTPGHTPDELALWDEKESMLYVGDTLYEDDPIIFSEEGSLPTWFSTINDLSSFVQSQPNASQVKINCGHATAMKPAMDVLEATKRFMNDVLSGKEPLKGRYQRRGVWIVEYRQATGRFSLRCPERLVLEARNPASI